MGPLITSHDRAHVSLPPERYGYSKERIFTERVLFLVELFALE